MKKTLKNTMAVLVVLSAIAAAPAWAAEGRTPVWEPVTIVNSGTYIVTRDIIVPAGVVINILSDNVDIDLNGFRLETAGANPVIAGGGENITIRNGIVFGGAAGISLSPARNVTIEDVKSTKSAGAGIELFDATGFALRRNQIIDCTTIGIAVGAPPLTETSGILEDNQVIRCQEGINIDNASSTILKLNRVEETTGSFGIRIGNSFGVLLDRNTVQDALAQGIWVEGSFACKLHNNLVLRSGGPGIELVATVDSLLLDNVVSQSGLDGVVIGGERNHIERNVMNFNGAGGAGWGLLIVAPDNVYRGNTARGNAGPPPAACGGAPATSDVCDSFAASSSLGDNFMPFLL